LELIGRLVEYFVVLSLGIVEDFSLGGLAQALQQLLLDRSVQLGCCKRFPLFALFSLLNLSVGRDELWPAKLYEGVICIITPLFDRKVEKDR
jgi:hypothetical protein